MVYSSSGWLKNLSFRNVALAFIAGFFLLQIGSLVISALFPSLGLFKGGPIVLVILLGIAIMSLFILGIRFDQLDYKRNLIFVILIFGLLIAAYYFLPQYVPQIFSANSLNEVIRSTISSILGGGS